MKRSVDQQRAQSAWLSATAPPQPGQVGGSTRSAASSRKTAEPAEKVRPFERQHAAMLSRHSGRVIHLCCPNTHPRAEPSAWSHRSPTRGCSAGAWRARIVAAIRARRFCCELVVADLAERLAAVERRFPVAIAHGGQTDALAEDAPRLRQGGPRVSARADRGRARAGRDRRAPSATRKRCRSARASIDLFVSTLALQWTNDLPGALLQIRTALRPDGLFLAAMTGGRDAHGAASIALRRRKRDAGRRQPARDPGGDVRDLGALLQRAGFALPVVDRDTVTARYASAFDLFRELRAMGATNALPDRDRRPARRKLFLRTAEIYAERFSDPDGRIRATFDIISLSGWAPHESQQKPARRGSGRGEPRGRARRAKNQDGEDRPTVRCRCCCRRRRRARR